MDVIICAIDADWHSFQVGNNPMNIGMDFVSQERSVAFCTEDDVHGNLA